MESSDQHPAPRTDAKRQLRFAVLPETFAVCRLEADAPTPPWALPAAAPFAALTRTDDELSVICPQDAVPGGITAERDWRALKVLGPLPFDAVGILVGLTAPLADAGIPIFAVSTFDTDYVLIKNDRLQAALEVLQQAGHRLSPPTRPRTTNTS